MSPTRREQLEAMLAEQPQDVFLHYALAMEFAGEGNEEAAVARLAEVTERDPDYQAAYFQLGRILVRRGKLDAARDWLERGIAAARRIGNAHAAGEMEQFLSEL